MVPNRTLFAGDCLGVLSDTDTFPDNCIDLIYLDPPFNSKAVYNLPFPTEHKKKLDLKPVMAFNDTWSWNDECNQNLKRWEEEGSLKNRNLVDLVTLTKRIRGERINAKDSMSAYLVNMAVRLEQMKRVLKPTGTIYLHCDPTASHYLKLMMDNVFGSSNFQNELIWCFSGGGVPRKDFPRKHNVIFRYTKGKDWKFRHEYKPYKENTQQVGIHSTLSGPDNKIDLERGTPVTSWWTDIPTVTGWSPERLGYPTQKPVKLLKRIIAASTDENDKVLDPFCGCGTSVHAAEELGRQWVGIDISQFSSGLVRNRIVESFFNRLTKSDIDIRGNPTTLTEAKSLAVRDAFEFEKWVCGEIGAQGMYHAPGSRGGDSGVDGIIPFYHTPETNKPEQAYSIVQVKGGRVTADSVRALAATIKQHKDNGFNSICGVFVCFKEYMRTVENNRDKSKVVNHLFKKSFDFIQPISIEELLDGKGPFLPGGFGKKAA